MQAGAESVKILSNWSSSWLPEDNTEILSDAIALQQSSQTGFPAWHRIENCGK